MNTITKKVTKERVKGILSKYSIYFILAGMVLIMTIATDNFFTLTNITNFIVSKAAVGLLALGVGLIIMTGGIDLSLGAMVSLSAVIGTSLVQELSYTGRILPNIGHVPAWVAVVVGLCVGLLFGLMHGYLIAYRNVPPFIATLGGMVMAEGIALSWTLGYPVAMLRNDFKVFGSAKPLGIPIVIIYLVIFAAITWVVLNRTRLGKAIYAIGGNKSAAVNSGINVKRTLMLVYIWSGFLSAFAGVSLAARSAAGISTMGSGYEMDAIEACVLGGVSMTGGVGRVGGIIAGILLLGILDNGLLLLGASPYVQKIIKGAIIILAVTIDMLKVSKKN